MSSVVDILDWLEEKPTLSRHVGAARKLDQLVADDPAALRTLPVAMIRNFTIEPVEPLLKVAAARVGVHTPVTYGSYDPAVDEDLDALLSTRPAVVVVALRLEELAPALTDDFLASAATPGLTDELAAAALDHVLALTDAARAAGAAVFVHAFVQPLEPAGGIADSQDPAGQLALVRRMNLELVQRVAAVDGAYVIDVDHLFAQVGLRETRDERGARTGDAPLSQAALRALADAYARHIRALSGPAAKVVVLDCDNTLWGGVVGEDGIAGIALGETGEGRRFRDLQQRLLDLRRRGVLLAICSKNEEADVLDVLSKHPDCLLSEDDFAAMRVNWDDKATNIESIAKELNLGLGHVVFVDDSPVECEWVKARLPEVRVLQWPQPAGGPQTLEDTGLFDSLLVTEEDRARTQMYKAESLRRDAQAGLADPEDYLRSLNMVATVGLAGGEHLPRLAQLTQRTNQFNLTTRRYDQPALEQLAADDGTRILWLSLADRFGSNGVVGCGIVRRYESNPEEAVVDTFLLSCRVLGRKVESVMANRLAREARDLGATTLVGEYIATERNTQVADLYERLGFVDNRWDLTGADPAVPDWFEVVEP